MNKGWFGLMLVAVAAAPAMSTIAAQQAGRERVVLDVFVSDRTDRPTTGLGAQDFEVVTAGVRRTILAADATGTPQTIVIVVDEGSFVHGSEKPFSNAGSKLVDRLDPTNRVALVTLPQPRGPLSLATDRTPIRKTLGKLAGRAASVDMAARRDDGSAGQPPLADANAQTGRASNQPVDAQRLALGTYARETSATDVREPSLEALAILLDALRGAPGPKQIVLLSAGMVETDPVRDERRTIGRRNLLQTLERAAVESRTTIHVLGLASASGPAMGWTELEQLAASTGGVLTSAGRKLDEPVNRLVRALSPPYLLTLAPAAIDDQAGPHVLQVTIARPDLELRAPRRYTVHRELAPAAPPASSPSPAPLASPSAPGRPPAAPPPAEPATMARSSVAAAAGPPVSGAAISRGVVTGEPELDAVLARSLEYLIRYRRAIANVVAEEEYFQTLTGTQVNGSNRQLRRTRSDFLMVTVANGTGWIPFRDVFEVDGKKVRDRDDRLRRLFLETPATAIDAAQQVRAEAARYNLGRSTRNINVPMQPLLFLASDVASRFRFRRGGVETVENIVAWRVDFEEVARPTLIRGQSNADVPSSGSYWLEPSTGRVLKTLLRARHPGYTPSDPGLTMETTVVYRKSAALDLWVPAEMHEWYTQRFERLEAHATYSNFRVFQVETSSEVVVPKKTPAP
ncbi:MAG TPA: hypothetical protein VGK32_04710 [Vicinamibacterales bacterium]|jgi:VWFA-related protein